MKKNYTDSEIQSAQAIIDTMNRGDLTQSINILDGLKDDVYAAIPDNYRNSRGITWVLRRISSMLIDLCEDSQLKEFADSLYQQLDNSDRLLGIPIFIMAEFGVNHPGEVLDFFESAGNSETWETREFAASGLQKIVKSNREFILPWLLQVVTSEKPNLRRLISETLRPVAIGRWLRDDPDYSLQVLRNLFRESHPYPRTSVGNNLSDLSKVHPERIFAIVEELVSYGDKNSYWIAERACRNLVKSDPIRVIDVLGVDEYHYKDRNYYREE